MVAALHSLQGEQSPGTHTQTHIDTCMHTHRFRGFVDDMWVGGENLVVELVMKT